MPDGGPPHLPLIVLHAAENESGEWSGVRPLAPRSCTGKLTHAARQFSHSDLHRLHKYGELCGQPLQSEHSYGRGEL